MKKNGLLGAAALLALGSALALTPLGATAASCKVGKEGEGCWLKVGGFIDKKDSNNPAVTVGDFQGANGKYRTQVNVPGKFLCGNQPGGKGSQVGVSAQSAKKAKVGGTVKLKGSGKSGNFSNDQITFSYDLKVKFTSAKKAKVTGTAQLNFGFDGSKCSRTISKNLSRVTGG